MASVSEDPRPQRMIALLVGNDEYSHPSNKLQQSVNNVNDISKLLKTINFDVNTVVNADRDTLLNAVRKQSEDNEDRDLILFYCTGRSYQINSVDYLIPSNDVSFDSDLKVTDGATSIQEVLNLLSNSSKLYALVCILDCLRAHHTGDARRSKGTFVLLSL